MMTCPSCGTELTTGGCPNVNCPTKIGSLTFTTKEIPTTPLEAWIDEAGLRRFVDQHLKIHADQWGVDDPEGLIRLIMISLRQELQEAGWSPPTRYVFQIDPTVSYPVKKPEAVLVVRDGERLKFVCGCGREMELAVDKREVCDGQEERTRGAGGDDHQPG